MRIAVFIARLAPPHPRQSRRRGGKTWSTTTGRHSDVSS
jgi:hypothetical protein